MIDSMIILFVIYQLDYADHIAIAYLSAIAKSLGHQTHICVLASDDLEESLRILKPAVVAYSANIVGAARLIELNRELQPRYQYVSIMGGPYPTYYPESFSDSSMDAYCVGEGEYAFRDFLNCVHANEPFDQVANLITAQCHNPVRSLIADLDELPMPDRDLILSHSYLKDTPKKTFYASRGCPYSCTYCANNYYQQLYRGKGKLLRRFSVDRLIREIQDVKAKYRMDFVKFGDDLFAPKVDDWLMAFSERYAREIGVPFNCFLRIDTITESLIQTLKKAGCHSVHLSIDSLSKEVRDSVFHRRMRDVDLKAILNMIRSHGIQTWVNFMLAAPESTLKDDLDTILFSKAARITYTNYSTTTPMSGTRLFDYAHSKGFLSDDYVSDMMATMEKSPLSCFSDKEKNIRYNIYLLGPTLAKLPFPLDRLGVWLIQIIPPLPFFQSIRRWVYTYYIENKIFKLPKHKKQR